MVTKTRRKRSAATRVKTADASKLRTRKRSKRSKRRRCRTAKRGGMIRSSAAALALYSRKIQSSFFKSLLHSLWSFFKTYFFKLGFLDGKFGLILAISNAQYTYYKYLKLSLLYQNKKS